MNRSELASPEIEPAHFGKLRRRNQIGIGLGLIVALLFLVAPSAEAAPGAAGALSISSFASPTALAPGFKTQSCNETLGGVESTCQFVRILVRSSGGAEAEGPVLITDRLPEGLSVVTHTGGEPAIEMIWIRPENESGGFKGLGRDCEITTEVRCLFPIGLEPDYAVEVQIEVSVEPGAPTGAVNRATASQAESPLAEAISEWPDQISTTPAPFGVGTLAAAASSANGRPELQAGGHPYEFTTLLGLRDVIRESPEVKTVPDSSEDVRDVAVDLPLGLLGSAEAAPKCTLVQLAALLSCPLSTRVGLIETRPESAASVNSGIFNIVPEHGVAAEFGFTDALRNTHVIYSRVVPTPQGYVLRATSPEVAQIPLTDIVATFFGNPAAKDGTGNTPVAMFTNPSDCSGQPQKTSAHLDSWTDPGRFLADGSPDLSDPAWATTSTTSPPVTGCNALQFKPSLTAAPESHSADTPSGLDVSIKVPQSTDPATLATPPLKKAVVTLPAGMTVNPSSANGLQGCSLAQVGISASGQPDGNQPTCPDASKIGTVELETPLLPGTLEGQIYVARQTENPFGSLLAMYIVVDDPTTGVLVKIPAEIQADSGDGRLTAIVDDSPQFPFSELRTHFFGGATASLKTPNTCGSYAVSTELTPWSAPQSGPPATPQGPLTIGSGANGAPCASSEAQLPNKPAFEAGTVTPIAGAYSPFVLKLRREDGSQLLSRIDATLPAGLLGKLAGISYCTEAQIHQAESRTGLGQGAQEVNSPSCPASSEVGTVTVGAGAGSRPFLATGHAYLAGPYKGAPLSLVVITPAVAGPFDLGSVVVRNALFVDETTTQIHAVSDPLPTILHGIPLDLRSITLDMNRPSFTLNPTSCDPKQIEGSATSTLGNVAPLTQRFQVGACGALGFKPELKLSLKGATKRAGVPALKAVLTYPKGSYANVKSISTVLPKSEFIDNAHIGNTCTRVQFNEGSGHGTKCPAKSVLGKAIAYSPLLEKPLEGTVYLRSNGGERELPDIVAALHGQIEVTLVGFIDSVKKSKHSEVSRIRTRFMNVPDAPVSRFVLQLAGAKHGLLQNSANLCKVKNIAQVKATAQNGLTYDTEPAVANDCGKGGKKSKSKVKH
jgi:hypothetical protein